MIKNIIVSDGVDRFTNTVNYLIIIKIVIVYPVCLMVNIFIVNSNTLIFFSFSFSGVYVIFWGIFYLFFCLLCDFIYFFITIFNEGFV